MTKANPQPKPRHLYRQIPAGHPDLIFDEDQPKKQDDGDKDGK